MAARVTGRGSTLRARDSPAAECIVLDDSDTEQGRRGCGTAGPSQPQAGGQRQQQRRQQHGSRRARQEEGDFIDLTNEPDSPRIELVSSTVQPVQLKRPRLATPLSKGASLSQLVEQARNPPPPPPPPPEPVGPQCKICFNPMGGNSGRGMASGPCGHVYCRECLTETVRTQRKCPTCRKNLQLRQLHQVFVEFS